MTNNLNNDISNDTTNDKSNLFTINSLKVAHRQKNLLDIDELALPTDKLIAIIGANGAGKSTLIHALLGQSVGQLSGCEVTGQIHCKGQSVQQVIQLGSIAWVGQHERFEVPLKVLDYALLGTMPNLAWYQQPSKQAVEQAKAYLADFDLIELADMRIQTLSGGEKQRMAIVRALMQQTDILLLDEPTNHLDIKHQRKLFSYLKQLVHQGDGQQHNQQHNQHNQHSQDKKHIIMVLHSLTDAYKYADYVVALAKGKILAQGSPDKVMTADNLKQMYEVDIKIYDTEDGKVFV